MAPILSRHRTGLTGKTSALSFISNTDSRPLNFESLVETVFIFNMDMDITAKYVKYVNFVFEISVHLSM